jgi:hypothetical protein
VKKIEPTKKTVPTAEAATRDEKPGADPIAKNVAPTMNALLAQTTIG